jgi:hypothetical protein
VEAVGRSSIEARALVRDLPGQELCAPVRDAGAQEVDAAARELGESVLPARRLAARRRRIREADREQASIV